MSKPLAVGDKVIYHLYNVVIKRYQQELWQGTIIEIGPSGDFPFLVTREHSEFHLPPISLKRKEIIRRIHG